MWSDLLTAVALLLVLEGILPFLSPTAARRFAARIDELGDSALRTMGFACMAAGVVLLYVI